MADPIVADTTHLHLTGVDGVVYNLRRYAEQGRPVSVRGIYQQNDGAERFEARDVYLLHSDPGRYLFEETHWWPTQVTQMADRILDHLKSDDEL